jgi:hypothetical protein
MTMPTPAGLTRERISIQTGIALATVCGRVCPTIEREILVPKFDSAGKPEHRLTKAGRYAQVIIINPNWEAK